MVFLLLAGLLALLSFAPSIWVRLMLKRHSVERKDLPGTGAELAVHLLRRFELTDVSVEKTDPWRDHYDPEARVIRLSPDIHDGRSLTAVAVAAHEVGHAIQFGRDEPISRLRRRYLPLANRIKQAGILILTLLPLVGIASRSPALIFALVLTSLMLQLIGALAYLIVLPEEWDASFGKALPILAEGEYLEDADLPSIRDVLKAAAFTYFARALADLVNVGRWALILRR